MQIVACPNCGAEVRFRSHAAVMAVCEYCRTGVLKEADTVRDLGKISAVLEDYSPIQLGTAGVLANRPFTVVGRLQLKYDAGMWNEWYLLFDDGANGWLGDASGQYTITTVRDVDGALPPFDQLRPGNQYTIGGERFTAADVRTARCIGGAGELPFRVEEGWQAMVADLRFGTRFVTLDYSDATDNLRPLVYTGMPVTLDGLRMQLLRDDDAIAASTGRYRGKLTALDCPSCGTAVNYLPGMTANLVCPACRAQLDAASPQVAVLQAGERVAAVKTTLALGAEGKLGNDRLTVIGVLRREDDEGTAWTEYLLYAPRAGFTWLVETDEGWQRSSVLDEWPAWQGDTAKLNTTSYRKRYDYEARVTFAAGAFNWRVQAGDLTRIAEFEQGQTTLAAEMTADELTWSRSKPVAFDQLQSWFGNAAAGAPAGRVPGTLKVGQRYRRAAKKLIIGLAVVNAIPLMTNFGGTFAFLAVAALALYLPATFLDGNDKE